MNSRDDYYGRIRAQHLSPLWEVLHDLVIERPRPKSVPALWRYAEIRPHIEESGRLISAREAVRRVLILENPGLPDGSAQITGSLYAGLQLILPGEVAPSHRHTQSALRFIVDGDGAYTAVDGERTVMHRGDFIITPAWTWHDHGNEGREPVVWLDGLDIPMVALFDAQFAETYPEESQPVARAEGDNRARWGSNMALVDAAAAGKTSPVFSYPYAASRSALQTMADAGALSEAHGVKMRYVNPTTGGWAMPTLGTFLQWLPKGFRGRPHRSTDGTVYCCVEGEGTVAIDDQRFDWGPQDIFVAPSWATVRFETRERAVLFGYSDRPVQEAMGLLRQELL